jgi:capsid protein
MMTALPMGWDASQMKSEHPNATYESFHRAQVSEGGRPKCMPHNLSGGDSSDHNFASGKLDFTPYYIELDVEREDGNDLVLEPLFEQWFDEAALRYGWNQIPDLYPPHEFDWPAHPVADEEAKANANEKKLKTGQMTLTRMYSELGDDFDDVLPEMAEDYGVSQDEMRKILLNATFNATGSQASMAQVENTDTSGATGEE